MGLMSIRCRLEWSDCASNMSLATAFTLIVGILMLNAHLSSGTTAKVFTPSVKLSPADRDFILDCLKQCASSDTCAATIMSVENGTCSLITMSGLQDMVIKDVSFRKTYPPPPCENGGYWSDSRKVSCICPYSFAGRYCQRYWYDCSEGFRNGATGTGVFTIEPNTSSPPFEVFCHMTFGGRTYFQKQHYGINFNRKWRDYREGFGEVTRDHWLGLEKIKAISDRVICQLIVHLTYPCCPKWRQINFKNFKLTDETDGYRMTFSEYNASTTSPKNKLNDTMTELKGAKFSTYDRDNDDNPTGSCPQIHGSGWWFKDCTRCNPNGRLKPVPVNVSGDPEELFWVGDERGVTGSSMALHCI
ncbi:angiopoietin-4-like [Haliotis rufescens]|uniref:angiopoietin-4-like n=1 Tax=Haliotis rufescens TaxID=6454 RepID=UPI00201E93E8|nr:angiopoietin-4-like [Haliotis rufescens]